ncbi:hypothetical protein [Allokutzneria albata]|uniref:Uncharacterized protein n=1 Tax=Allokutzneria albata TaxID=211114 RepID=A0A1G9W9Z8_ALLAB|nr:hypothetical protein [Allokutzneria albata]SDM81051.1 hypothetical protein SAMN04489726_3471 [Allokutzneria albata]
MRTLAVVLAVLMSATTVLPAQAAPVMSRFVVAIGGLNTASSANWVRLANYSLTASGTVSESHFHWSQKDRVKRSYTGVTGKNCVARACQVQTANGFQAGSPPRKLSGKYTLNGSVLRVTWDSAGWEEWTVSQPIAGKLTKLSFRASSFKATHGYGYGSDAKWDQRASMAKIAAADHNAFEHQYHLWKTDAGKPYLDQGSGSPFWQRDWKTCASSRCLGGKTPTTQYYLSTANATANDRRDTIWHWRTALADGRGEHCYTGNSHVKPLMQIIDSDGNFHGWVGVEASLNQTSPAQGTDADDIGVFRISRY